MPVALVTDRRSFTSSISSRESADCACRSRKSAGVVYSRRNGTGSARKPIPRTFPNRLKVTTYLPGIYAPGAEDPESVPAHDVLLAGFPCQPFSIAGVSKKNALGQPHGFLCDTQGTLFYDLAKIIDHHRPPAFLLENVKNLERHDGGRTFATIMNVLENELGYSVSCRVVDSSPWVPQKRQRIFMVGFREKTTFDFSELAIPAGQGPLLRAILDTEVDPKYTLTEHLWNYLQDYKQKHRNAGNGFGYSLFGPDDVARTLSARYYKDGSEILIRQEEKRPRRLTPRECARLMGFEKPGEAKFRIPVSDTQAYRQFGNAVVVPVIRAVARLMKPHISELLAREGRNLFNRATKGISLGRTRHFPLNHACRHCETRSPQPDDGRNPGEGHQTGAADPVGPAQTRFPVPPVPPGSSGQARSCVSEIQGGYSGAWMLLAWP